MARSVKTLGVLALALGLLLPGGAAAQDALTQEWLSAQVNEQGQRCERRAEQRDGNRVLVACGAAGVWEVTLTDAGPRFVKSFGFSGEAVGFFTEADGRLWVKLQVLEARPVSSASSPASESTPASPGAVPFPDEGPAAKPPAAPVVQESHTSEPGAKAREPVQKRVGRVVRTEPGAVVISLGSDDGLARADRIELALQLDGSYDGEAALSRESLAVGVVTHVTERSARVRLGINEAVPLGAVATPTKSAATGSLTAPPRVGQLWTVDVMGRPFAALDELGAGILLSASVGRRFASNFHLRAVLDPLAFADVKNNHSENAINATVLVSYDSHYFEMGLGLGGQTVNDTAFLLSPGSGLAVAQLIRLGAQDGLNISARTSIVLFHSQFDFGGMVGSMQIPVSRGYWLLLGGGGGSVGYGYGEFGLRALLRGNGLAGSRFLTVTAGGAAVFSNGSCDAFNLCQQAVTYGGPMAGIGYEWRF